MVVATAAASGLTGYLLIRPGVQPLSFGDSGTATILNRFSGLPGPTITPLPDGLLQLTTDATLAAANDAESDSVLYYHRSNGFVTKAGLTDHSLETISDTALPRLTDVIWSPDRTQVLSVYFSKNGDVYKYFNYTTRQTITLGGTIAAAAFSPDSSRIAVARVLGDETDIVLSQPDGTIPKTILKTHLSNISLAWPSEHVLSILVRHDDGSGDDLYTVTDTGELNKVLEGQQNLKIAWSPDGARLLYSVTANGQTTLSLHSDGSDDGSVPIMTTADLCSWRMDGRSFVCFTDDGETSSIREATVADNSVKTLASKLIASPETVFLSHLEDFLVLVDRTDHSLWAIKLPN